MSTTNRAIKYRLYPTEEQKQLLSINFGHARFVYNKTLEEQINLYKNSKSHMSANTAKKWLVSNLKANNPFLYEADSVALQYSIESLDLAYKSFFNKSSGFPKFKKKDNTQSYTTKVTNNNIKIVDNYIKVPKIGYIKIKRHRTPQSGWVLKRITITKDCTDKYYVACNFEYETDVTPKEITTVIGLDYKSDGLYCDSNGIICHMPKFYKASQKKLAKLQKSLSRKKLNSNNYKKAKIKVAKLHDKISNQRKDFLHKESLKIANSYDLVCIETLDLKSIASSKSKYKLGKATNDNGFNMFVSFLEYKLSDRGKQLIRVDKFYPSTQICSECGQRHKMSLDERIFRCNCGLVIDRDFNAAINIKNEGLRLHQLQVS